MTKVSTTAATAGSANATTKGGTATTTTTASTKSTIPTVTKKHTVSSSSEWYYHVIWSSVLVYMAYIAIQQAYTIRLRAITEYGPVIHEFDPYFNYRATEVRTVRVVSICFYLFLYIYIYNIYIFHFVI